MLIDIIIPVYKPNKWLFEALDSVYNQTYDNWNITIIDDCTPLPNKIIEKIKLIANTNSKINYIRLSSNMRATGARNFGIEKCNGDLIAFLDQDDKWYPDKLKIYVDYFRSNPEIKLFHSDIEGIDEHNNIQNNMFDSENNYRKNVCYKDLKNNVLTKELFRRYSVRLGTVILNKDAFEKIGGFDSELFGGEDEEFIVRFASKYPIGYINQKLTYRRVHKGNVSKTHKDKRIFGVLKSMEKMGKAYPFLVDSLFHEKYIVIMRRYILFCMENNEWESAKKYSIRLIQLKPFDPKSITLLIYSLFKIDIQYIYSVYMYLKNHKRK